MSHELSISGTCDPWEDRVIIAEVGVRGAQLCKTGKAGAASFEEVRARNINDGPAPGPTHTWGT
jgi:hypothetical protein